MTEHEATQLTHEELVKLVLAQAQQIDALKKENEALRLKLEKIQKPPTNSTNSSQPPSRDQKSNLPAKRKRHRHGPPLGHEKHERKFVADPEHIVEVKPQVCEYCQSDLSQEAHELVDVNQITEVPEARAEVIEVRQYETVCPSCGQEQDMSYVRTQAALQCLNGVELSQGGIDQIMHRAGRAALTQVGAIQTEIQQSAVVYSDETGSRVDGGNWWQWVFCSSRAVLHVIRFNRSEDVIRDVMAGHHAKVWVSDCLPAQLKAPARERQLCMAHQIRNLQALIDHFPKYSWPREMQALFRSAIHLHHQRGQLSPPQFLAQVRKTERRCNQLLKRSLRRPEAAILLRRYRKYRDSLFVFLHRSDVEPTNNISERNLRPSVIHRKVIGCFRSGWGARTYAALASVNDTSSFEGTPPFTAIQYLVGTPALPIAAEV